MSKDYEINEDGIVPKVLSEMMITEYEFSHTHNQESALFENLSLLHKSHEVLRERAVKLKSEMNDDESDSRYHDGFLDGETKQRGILGSQIDKLNEKVSELGDFAYDAGHRYGELYKEFKELKALVYSPTMSGGLTYKFLFNEQREEVTKLNNQIDHLLKYREEPYGEAVRLQNCNLELNKKIAKGKDIIKDMYEDLNLSLKKQLSVKDITFLNIRKEYYADILKEMEE